MNSPKLNKDDILIVKEDFTVPGTGTTFFFYKGYKYKIITYLTNWHEHAWKIKLIGQKKGNEELEFWFSEENLFIRFECRKYSRLKKLQKLAKINE